MQTSDYYADQAETHVARAKVAVTSQRMAASAAVAQVYASLAVAAAITDHEYWTHRRFLDS